MSFDRRIVLDFGIGKLYTELMLIIISKEERDMSKVTISDAIRYVGVDDKDLDLFEGQYIIPNGVSYNSYLIMDDKIALMDTVDARKTQEWLENVETELGGRTPDYLVISHLEPDHSGSMML